MITSDERRRFLEMSLVAAGAGLPVIGRTEDAAPRGDAKSTYLVIYRPGPRWLSGQPLSAQPLREHGRYMLSLHREGLLRQAGGFADHSGGAAAFEARDDAHASALIAADPAVVSQIMTCALHPWALVDWAALASRAR